MTCDYCDHAPCICDPDDDALINAGLYPCPCGCGNYANGAPIYGYRHKPCVYDSPADRAVAQRIGLAPLMSIDIPKEESHHA